MPQTDNLRITKTRGLIPPIIMLEELPITPQAAELITQTRQAIHQQLYGHDKRLLVLVGPCSIHDEQAALAYGEKLLEAAKTYQKQLHIIMRVYFEKPRTTVGWKGYINDPQLDGSFQINKGLRLARHLLLTLNSMGLPCGTEFLDVISPQYIADLISWGAIGARTTESQIHRELASGLSAPTGFKNGTDGNIQIAIDAMNAARSSHHFLSVTKHGNTAIFTTEGNQDTHLILRGSNDGPNYDAQTVTQAARQLQQHQLPAKIMIDCSHGNSCKDHNKQPTVAAEVARQIRAGAHHILGVMLESHLIAGKQVLGQQPLVYGQSITDACISWEQTLPVLEQLANAAEQRG